MSKDKASASALDPGGSEAVAAFRLLFTVSARLRARMDRLLAPITTQQAAVLTVIGAGAPSVSEVAGALSTTHQNVKQVARALERKGFVRIEGDPRDGRVRRLVATEKSARHWAQRDPGDHAQTAAWFDALAPGELTALVATLRKLEASLRREPARGLPADEAARLHSACMADPPTPPLAPLARIVGFRTDAEGHAVAELACGHTQHVRHRPPLESRPWVLTEEGRAGKVGAELPCPACRMPRLPPGIAEYKRTAELTADTVPAGLLRTHTLKAGTWGELVVLEGHVRYVLEDQGDAVVVLRPELAGTIAPEAPHRVEVPVGARFFVRFLR